MLLPTTSGMLTRIPQAVYIDKLSFLFPLISQPSNPFIFFFTLPTFHSVKECAKRHEDTRLVHKADKGVPPVSKQWLCETGQRGEIRHREMYMGKKIGINLEDLSSTQIKTRLIDFELKIFIYQFV